MTPASTEKVDFSKKRKRKNKNRTKKNNPTGKNHQKEKKLDLSQCLLFYFICAVVLILLFFLILVFFFSVCSDFVFWFYIVFSVEPYIICALGLINPTIIIYWYLLKLRLERLFLTVTAGKPRPSLQALRLATFALAVPRLMRHMRSQEPRGMARTGQNTIHSLVYPRISQASQV